MIAVKFVAPLLQFSAQLAVIVNLSVKDNDELCVVRQYRLMPARQIEHRQAPAGQMHRWIRGHPSPRIVRATMPQQDRHVLQRLAWTGTDETADATHKISPPGESSRARKRLPRRPFRWARRTFATL